MGDRQAALTGAQAGYGAVDRLVHRIAFATFQAQAGLCGLEDRLFAERLAGVEIANPVFVTALPRAGTTLLLELLAALPEFAAHTYRDMPFLLCPLLWNRFSGRFQRNEALRERAHGDGMMISFDSAEAFEEALWKVFWPGHYRADRIAPWTGLDDPEFLDFFSSHMKKIIALRCARGDPRNRYLSKNNMNVARLPALARLIPSAIFLVPFRDPLQHAASLLRQHERFLEVHGRDGFAKTYMAAIGHYDFGANLRPIDFDGWLDRRASGAPTTLGFWLEYWTACYRHLLSALGASVLLVSYDRLVARPEQGLEALARRLDLSDRAGFRAQASRLSAAEPRMLDLGSVDPAIIERAQALEKELHHVSIL